MESDAEPDYSEPRAYQPPFCCACGVPVCDDEDLDDYNFYYQGRKVALLWTSNYRAIVREQRKPTRQGDQNFRLSGVSRFHHPDGRRPLECKNPTRGIRVFRVPRDKKDTITDRRHIIGKDKSLRQKTMAVYPANFWDTRHQDLYPHGFPIHAHCWTMIRRVFGQSAEDEMDLFLEALHQRWKMKPRPFELGKCVRRGYWMADPREEDVELRALWDPGDIPEIQSVIRRSSLRRSTGPGTSPQRLGGLNLPLDVILQILDYLQATDLENLLVTTRWQVPGSYWRSRFPWKLIFEAEELISSQTEDVDWQFLYLEVEKLIEYNPSLGMQNRKRIFRVLEGTRQLFHSRLLS